MPTDFDPTALLSKPADDFKAPPQAVPGSYVGVATKREFDKAKNEKQTPLVRFTVVAQEPLPDVDEEAWAAYLAGLKEVDKALNQVEHRLEFWLTPESMYRLTEFGRDHVQVSPEEAGTMAELIEAIIGRPFVFTLVQQQNKKNPERPYINIGSTGPVPTE